MTIIACSEKHFNLYHYSISKIEMFAKSIFLKRNFCSLRGKNIFKPEISHEPGKVEQKVLNDFKKFLKSSGISLKDGFTSIQTECKACYKQSHQPAYINKTTGLFLCPTCDLKQPLKEIRKYYEKNTYIQQDSLVLYEYKSLSSNLDEFPLDMGEILKIRNFNMSCLQNIGAKYNAKSRKIYFPLKNVSGKLVGEKVLHSTTNKEETFPAENCSGLLRFGPSNSTKAVLVSNVLDFLALIGQKLEGYNIFCLPYGLHSLPQECLPVLEAYDELVFWFDFDSAGWDVARNFSMKLDEKRCLFIRPTDVQPTPFKALKKQWNLKHIIQRAHSIRHKSITTFSELKQDILSELQNIEKVNGVKWKRYPILNKLLKGHRKGELTILTGPTGSGKTTFMSEYSLDLALQGVSTLWGSFEIRNTRLALTLLRQFVGYPLDDKLHEFDYWASEFEKYPMYFMTFHGQQSIKVVMDAIEHAQYIYDIKHVIIDNIQFMMGMSLINKNDKFFEQDAIIGAFRSYATRNNVHVTLVMHPRKERESEELTTSSIFGSAKATQEADNVLIIQDKRLTSVGGKKFLQVAKNRYTGDLGIMPLEFDKEGLSYVKKKKKPKEEVKS